MSHLQSSLRVIIVGLVVALLVGCPSSSSDTCSDCGADGTTSSARSAPVEDWSARVPTFAVALQVVDDEGAPVAGAEVAVGARIILTDKQGWVRYGDLRALSPQVMRGSHTGYMPAVWTPTLIASGLAVQQVVLHRLPDAIGVDPQKPLTFASTGAQFRLPGLAFADKEGGRLTAPLKARVLSLDGAVWPHHALPGDRLATGADGRPVALGSPLQLVYVAVEDDGGAAVRFAPGVSATVTLRISSWPLAGVDAGAVLGLYALDEQGHFRQESSCVVHETQHGAVCSGAISHFGTWLLALERKRDGELGCVYVEVESADSLFPGLGSAGLTHLPLQLCGGDGQACTTDEQLARGLTVQLPPTDASLPAMCSLVTTGERYGARVAARGGDGRIAVATATFTAEAEQSVAAADWLQRGLPVDWDCATRCQRVVIKPGSPVLSGLQDADGDGYVATAGGTASAELAGFSDCDDADPTVHVGALEGPCSEVDRDCDGHSAGSAEKYTAPVSAGESCALTIGQLHAGRPACAALFNQVCDAACFSRESEKRGNEVDEDCDGRIFDVDGDGFASWESEAGVEIDCDDYESAAGPDQSEIAGNALDEDCDGLTLDADGDGYFGFGQEMVAMRLGLVAADELDRLGDCDDRDPSIHPGADLSVEVGQMAQLFVDDGDRGRLRLATFCDYFAADGQPTELFYRRIRDANCDGQLTDLDGDGLASIGDRTLGTELAVDCNDFDPRIGKAETDEECDDFASTLNNGSICYPQLTEEEEGTACPSLPNSTTEVECMDVGNGAGLCLYSGWNGSDPPRLMPGTLWGPCDGPGRLLPDCPAHTFCGAPVSFSSEALSFLQEYFAGGETLDVTGMCFQSCAVEQD